MTKDVPMILQKSIPHNPLETVRLPGIKPLDIQNWLVPDDAFTGQMARRAALLSQSRAEVLMMDAGALAAAQELLQMVLDHRYGGLEGAPQAVSGRQAVTRSDGVVIELDWDDPLGTLGHLCQEDFCILQRPEGSAEHVLTGAVLCFPASWKLSEKFMRPLIGIHDTVDSYDDGIATRVQRLFDGVQSGKPLWRFNALWYQSPELHTPRGVHDPRDRSHGMDAPYMRSEQQVILRLPKTGAVVFSIHTYMVLKEDVMRQWGSVSLTSNSE